jgi:phospholipase C
MLENRSFDHMFGFLKSPDYAIDGLNGDESNPDENGQQVFVSADARYSGDFTPDPGHHFPSVNTQIFGNEAGTGPATMQGFVKAYRAMGGSSLTQSHKIMRCYAPSKIPILTTLAREYAICDHWYSSIPGPTLPNRAFAHAATSIGRVDMDPIWFSIGKTIYELLAESGVSSKIYFHDATVAMTFRNLLGNQKFFGSFDDFLDACSKGKLPAYTFIEPRYNADDKNNLAANDQHPDHDVAEGETLIHDVYDAVFKSKQWPNTVLVVTYDEHGGLYDHVVPPLAPNPDGKICKDPPFDFTRLGIRVPSVVVSPWIPKGTIDHTQYEHSSIAATARKMFLGAAWETKFLTARDKGANPFDRVLTLNSPRTEQVKFDAPRNLAALARAGNTALVAARTATHAALPLSELQQTLVAQTSFANQTLHPDAKSTTTPHDIRTEAQAAAFHQEVAPKIQVGEPKTQAGGGA